MAVSGPGRVRILAPEGLVEGLLRALPEADEDVIWIETELKGTAPALARAAWEIEALEPGALMTSLHADHAIGPMREFERTIAVALGLAAREPTLVCVAAPPSRAETGYGYVEPGAELPTDTGLPTVPDRVAVPNPPGVAVGSGADRSSDAREERKPAAFKVASFHEKPDRETARRYCDAGFLWNTGIFVWRASTFLEETRMRAPEIGRLLDGLERDGPPAFFKESPSAVVDRAILERSDRVSAVRASFDWDDVGSWEALARQGSADDCGNSLHGPVRVLAGRDNIVFAEGGRVVVHGIDDAIIVRTDKVTLVLGRDRSDELRSVLESIGESS